jgi:hypothetical protein
MTLPNSLKDIVASQSGRIKWVAERLYPLGRGASAVGIGRTTLYRWVSGRKRPFRGADDVLLLMARERVASQRRAREIAKVEKDDITWAEIWAGHPAEAAFREMYPGWLVESEEATT